MIRNYRDSSSEPNAKITFIARNQTLNRKKQYIVNNSKIIANYIFCFEKNTFQVNINIHVITIRNFNTSKFYMVHLHSLSISMKYKIIFKDWWSQN